jgi:hypothetical protein
MALCTPLYVAYTPTYRVALSSKRRYVQTDPESVTGGEATIKLTLPGFEATASTR